MRPLGATDLAPLDQFHTRGLRATMELASEAEIGSDMRVLDIGAGLGGPARFLAATYGCRVTGIDASPSFVEVATYLAERTGMSEYVDFRHGDALTLPFDDESFDVVWMQHVAMNIADRDALYREIRRVLVPGGRYVTYDVVADAGSVRYPVPWAADATTSHLRTQPETLAALRGAGLRIRSARSETPLALQWFAGQSGPPSAIGLGLVLGAEAPQRIANLRENLAAGHIGILACIAERMALSV
jgi:SAM-dependent methyltransferase